MYVSDFWRLIKNSYSVYIFIYVCMWICVVNHGSAEECVLK